MIASEALAAWLESREARNTTQAAMRALAAKVSAMPAFVTLDQGLAPAAEAGAEAVLGLARAFMEDGAALAGLIAAAVSAAAADPMCRPPMRASRNDVQDGLLLFSRPALVVQLAVMNADALAIKRRGGGHAAVAFTGQRTLYRFLKGGDSTLLLYETPVIDAGFTAAAAARCRLRERRRLADGDTIELDGRREAFVLEGAATDPVCLFASTSLDASPVGTEYDGRTLELVAAGSTDEAGSRTQMMLALLRTMGRRDSAPWFAAALRASHFHTRWQAMREFLALDAELALPHLRSMARSDRHPEVRAAAAETLAAFFPERSAPCPA